MKMKLYTIRDKVADEAGPIYQAKNDAIAVRQFNNLMANQQVDVVDYALYCVGEFDTEAMTIEPDIRMVDMMFSKQEVEDEQ